MTNRKTLRLQRFALFQLCLNNRYYTEGITKHSSALYIGIAKVLPIIDVLGYDGQNSSFSSSSSSSSCSDSTPITQKGSHIST